MDPVGAVDVVAGLVANKVVGAVDVVDVVDAVDAIDRSNDFYQHVKVQEWILRRFHELRPFPVWDQLAATAPVLLFRA